MPTILVVEDDSLNLEMVKSFLSLNGYDAAAAVTAEEGLRLAQQTPLLAALIDLRLPGGMDGLELGRRMKANAALADIPLIAITAHNEPGLEQAAYQAGFEGFLMKPLSLAKLKQAIMATVR
ncbi:MAG: response regulator [bacterium]|nr:response regulator [bacterium]